MWKKAEKEADEEAQASEETKEAKTQEQVRGFKMSEKNALENPFHDKMSVGIHAVVAIAVGYLSLIMAAMFGNWITVFAGFGLLILMGFALQKGLGNKGIKWWMGNGVFIYLFIWLISWTFFFNMAM